MSTSIQAEPGTATPPAKSRPLLRVFAWVLMIGLGVCLLASISAGSLGLRVGSVDAYYQQPRTAPAPIAALVDGSTEPLPGTTITIWFLKGPRYFKEETIFASDLSRGQTEEGRLAYHIAFDEAGFNQYMTYWFVPTDEDLAQIVEGIRNPHIDLRPGGLTLYADVQVGSGWQSAGLVYDLDESATQLKFIGIQMGDTMLSTAPDSFLNKDVGGIIERLSNRALRELTFIDKETGQNLTIHQIYIDEDAAEVLALAD